MTRANVIARNAAALAIGQVVTWTFSLLYMGIVPRDVGPAEWGDYVLAGALIGVATSVAGLGIPTLLIKEIVRNRDRAADLVGAALATRVLQSLGFIAIVAGMIVFSHYSTHTRVIIGIVTVTALINFLFGPVAWTLQAREDMHLNTICSIIGNGVVAVAAVVLVKVYAAGMIEIALIETGAALIVVSLQVRWLSRSTRVRLRFDWPLIRFMIVGSLPYWATSLFLTIYIWIDSVMLSYMAPPDVIGWYGVATKLYASLLFIPYILTTAFFPALSEHFRTNRDEMGRLARRGFTLLTTLSLPITAGTVLVGPAVIQLLYGNSYAPAGPVIIVLGLSLVFTYPNIQVNQILMAADRQVIWTRVMAAACVVNPLINLVAISYFQRAQGNGALGAAYALLVTEILMTVTGFLVLPRELLGRAIVAPVVRSAIATAIMGGLVWLVRDAFVVPVLAHNNAGIALAVILRVALGAVTFVIAAVALRVFPQEDVALLMGLVTKMTRRAGLRYRLRTSAHEREMGMRMTALDLITEDLRTWRRNELARERHEAVALTGRDTLRLLWSYPGLRATLTYRISAETLRLRIPILPGILARRNVRRHGVDIAPWVLIGPGLYMPHPTATVIRAHAIGRNCQIISAVTIGSEHTLARPEIGNDVVIEAGVRMAGDIAIGDHAHIQANAVVATDVPRGATVTCPAARIASWEPSWPAEPRGATELVPAIAGIGATDGGAKPAQ